MTKLLVNGKVVFLLATSVESLPHFGERSSSMSHRNLSWEQMVKAMAHLNQKQRLVLFQDPERLKVLAEGRLAEIAANTHTVHLDDDLVPKAYHDLLRPWRNALHGTNYSREPVAWRHGRGYDIKKHGNLSGHCYKQLHGIERYKFVNSAPTTSSIIFWHPSLAKGNGHRTVPQMIVRRNERREHYGLPAHHCQSFGTISELFSLFFAYYNYNGERAPFFGHYAVSDTMLTDGTYACAGAYGDDGLHCAAWNDKFVNAGYEFHLIGKEELKK